MNVYVIAISCYGFLLFFAALIILSFATLRLRKFAALKQETRLDNVFVNACRRFLWPFLLLRAVNLLLVLLFFQNRTSNINSWPEFAVLCSRLFSADAVWAVELVYARSGKINNDGLNISIFIGVTVLHSLVFSIAATLLAYLIHINRRQHRVLE